MAVRRRVVREGTHGAADTPRTGRQARERSRETFCNRRGEVKEECERREQNYSIAKGSQLEIKDKTGIFPQPATETQDKPRARGRCCYQEERGKGRIEESKSITKGS